MDPASVFPSKVDAWFMFVFYGGGLALGAGAFALWKKSRGGASVMGAVAFVFCGVSYSAQSLKYELAADGWVHTKGGLVPGGPVAEIARIDKIEPSTDSSSAPAASLDRLRIDWTGPDGRARHVLISPEDKAGFLDAVAERNPRLLRSGESLAVVEPGDAGRH